MNMLAISECIARSQRLVAIAAERVRLAHISSQGSSDLLRSAREAIIRSHQLLAKTETDGLRSR